MGPRSAPSWSSWRWTSLFSCPARVGPGESSTAFPRLQSRRRARIARPDRRRRGPPCRPGRPSGRSRATRPGRSPSAARRPSWRRSSGSASTAIRRRGKFLLIDLERDAIVVNPMLTGRFQLAAPGDEAADEDGRRPRLRAAGGGPPRDAAPLDARARPGCRPTTRRSRSATATRPRWARSTSLPGRRRPARARPRTTDLGPDADDPGADPRGLARADPAPPGRAQEPAPQPGVRGRDRQRLQRRDPPRRAAAAVPQAVDASRAEEVDALYAATRDDAGDARSTCCASACRRPSRSRSATSWRSTTRAASPVRAAGRGSPRSSAGGFVTSYCRGCQR